MTPASSDPYVRITDEIIAAIEAGAGDFVMPWHLESGPMMRPENIATGHPYQGVNILILWTAARARGYASPLWGSYRQWQAAGCQVRAGERAVHGVAYRPAPAQDDTSDRENARKRIAFARAIQLFNADQVSGYTPPLAGFEAEPPANAPCDEAERIIAGTGAVFREGGAIACYRPASDDILMPPKSAFTGSPTRSAAEAWYSVKLHELVHWTGAAHRLDRNLSGRFGEAAYAMEELIAELGAAFLCADLDISPEPRRDHAQYLTSWLQVLRADSRAILRAAGQAQLAARFVHDCGWALEAAGAMRARIAEQADPSPPHPTPAEPVPAPPSALGRSPGSGSDRLEPK